MEKLIGEFSLGLFFWQSLIFIGLFFLLKKFAWKPILDAVNERETSIKDALASAEAARNEMESLQSDNQRILKEARAERDQILKEAKEAATGMVEDAKGKAKEEAAKIVESARQTINSEKAAAMAELKNHVASLSLEIAEKVVRQELSSDDKQKALATQLAGEIKMN